jgi:hypothetical protein
VESLTESDGLGIHITVRLGDTEVVRRLSAGSVALLDLVNRQCKNLVLGWIIQV